MALQSFTCFSALKEGLLCAQSLSFIFQFRGEWLVARVTDLLAAAESLMLGVILSHIATPCLLSENN